MRAFPQKFASIGLTPYYLQCMLVTFLAADVPGNTEHCHLLKLEHIIQMVTGGQHQCGAWQAAGAGGDGLLC